MNNFLTGLKYRAKSKAFWYGIVSGGVMVARQFGFDIPDQTVNNVLTAITDIGILFGVWSIYEVPSEKP